MENKKNQKYIQATGRHKEAVAQVRLISGNGKMVINNQEIDKVDQQIYSPLKLTALDKKYNVSVKVKGGGIIGQSKAIRLGIARAIVKSDQETRTTLKKAGFLKRDPRRKERKKYGLKGARRAPQWSKR